jgi:hypothetical protein
MQELKTVARAGGAAKTHRHAERIVDFTCVRKRTLNSENADRLEKPFRRGVALPEQCS